MENKLNQEDSEKEFFIEELDDLGEEESVSPADESECSESDTAAEAASSPDADVRDDRKEAVTESTALETAVVADSETLTEEELTDGDRSQEHRHHPLRRIAAVSAAAAVLAVAVYTLKAQSYHSVFFPRSSINGIDVSGRSAREAEQLLNEQVKNYELRILARETEPVAIHGEEIGLRCIFDDSFDRLIAAQSPMQWGLKLAQATDYQIDTITAIDETLFDETLRALPFLDSSRFLYPIDAGISYSAGGYSISPEQEGTALDIPATKKAIGNAVASLTPELKLKDAGVYEEPRLHAGDASVIAACENMNRYAGAEINYSDKGISLSGSTIKNWLSLDADGNAVIDETALTAFVHSLAEQYDSYNKPRPFKTSWGATITIQNGSYGWQMDQAAESAWLKSAIENGERVQRTPEFSKKAASHGASDFGDSYIEVNLTAQHLYYYKNGKQLLSTDLVSGNVSRGTVTHTGIYQINYKQRNATLRGANYATPVSYWMPFHNGEGLHDAGWRSSFGGSIYKTGGSHGCLNLPPGAAKQLFETVSTGTPVIIYTLAGTESKGSGTQPAATKESSAAESSAAPTETAPQATQPTEQRGPGDVIRESQEAERRNESNQTPDSNRATVAPIPAAEEDRGPGTVTENSYTAGPGTVQPAPARPEASAAEAGPGL